MSPNVALISVAIAVLSLVAAIFAASWLNQRKVKKLLEQFERRVNERFDSFEQRVDERLILFEQHCNQHLISLEHRLESVEQHFDPRLDSAEQHLDHSASTRSVFQTGFIARRFIPWRPPASRSLSSLN